MKNFILFYRRFSSQSSLEKLLLKMPKDTTQHIERNQKQRIKIREKSKFYSPGTVNLQVIGNGARGTSSCVHLFSEQTRYIFNCGEGTQRLAHEHKTKLARMENVFLTRNTWNRFGGVPGLCLTLQEIGVPQLNLHGPSGIEGIFRSTRKFVVLNNMRVVAPECVDGGFFEDSVMKVSYIPLCKSIASEANSLSDSEKSPLKVNTNEKDLSKTTTSEQLNPSDLFKDDDTDYYGYEKNDKTFNKNSPLSRTNEQFISKTTSDSGMLETDDTVMAYICKLKERTGTLDFEKCVNKGVKPGPLLGRLKNGFDVTLPDGSLVKAEDVRGPSSPGSVFIFVDIPDETYLPSLKNCEAFKKHQNQAVKDDDFALIVVHFSPENMMQNTEYKEWMEQFPISTVHWFINERNQFSGYFSSHRVQRQLNALEPDVFPMLKEPHPNMSNAPKTDFEDVQGQDNPAKKIKIDTEETKIEEPSEDKFKEYPELVTLSSFHFRPMRGFHRNLEPCLNPETTTEEISAEQNLDELMDKFRLEANKLIVTRSQTERAKEFPRIVTLGTGSCIPNKTRNVSANLVHINENSCVLLDCGEGTLGQIIRFYGREGADDVLRNLRMIYISHLHADHHLGLIDILNRRRKVTSDKVLLLAPAQISSWMTFYNYRIEEIYSTFELVSCGDLLYYNTVDAVKEKLYKRVGLVKIETCFVKHCPYSYGISLEMQNTMKSERYPGETVKLTYSGDTIPSEDLITLGRNSDVLIHEATMEDDLYKEAQIKMHSTVSQAVEVGHRMNAKFTILTHFSQRYARIPILTKNVENVAIAFDNMEVTLNDLPMMHLMYEPLKAIFSEHLDNLEQKALKRKHKQERKNKESNFLNGNQTKAMKIASSGQD